MVAAYERGGSAAWQMNLMTQQLASCIAIMSGTNVIIAGMAGGRASEWARGIAATENRFWANERGWSFEAMELLLPP